MKVLNLRSETNQIRKTINNAFYSVPDVALQEQITPELPTGGLFKFHDSFGYDSHKRANLHVFPGRRILFSAGNLLIFK